MKLQDWVTIVNFLVVLSTLCLADSRCRDKNEIFSSCVGCEETCQTVKPYTCVCHYGCKCKNGYKMDENVNECVPSWKCPSTGAGGEHNPEDTKTPILDTVFGEPANTAKNAGEELSKAAQDTGKWVDNLVSKVTHDFENFYIGVHQIFVTKPLQGSFKFIGNLGDYSGKWAQGFWNAFVEKPLSGLGKYLLKIGVHVGIYIKNVFEFLAQLNRQFYDSFLRKPAKFFSDAFHQLQRLIKSYFQYIWDVIKVLLSQGYIHFIKKPMEVLGALLDLSGEVLIRAFRSLVSFINVTSQQAFQFFVQNPYEYFRQFYEKLGDQTKEFVSHLNTGTQEFLAKSYDAFWKKPMKTFQRYWRYIQEYVLPQINNTFVTKPSEAIRSIVSVITKNIGGVFNGIWNGIKSFTESTTNVIHSSFNAIGSTIKNILDGLFDILIRKPLELTGRSVHKAYKSVDQSVDKIQDSVKGKDKMPPNRAIGEDGKLQKENYKLHHEKQKVELAQEPIKIGFEVKETVIEGPEEEIYEKPFAFGDKVSDQIKELVTPEKPAPLMSMMLNGEPEFIGGGENSKNDYGKANFGDSMIRVPGPKEQSKKEMEIKEKEIKNEELQKDVRKKERKQKIKTERSKLAKKSLAKHQSKPIKDAPFNDNEKAVKFPA